MSQIETFTSTGSKLIYHPQVVSRIRKSRKALPISLQLAPTSRCNLQCSFCSNVNRDKHEDLNYSDMIYFIHRLRLLGLKAVELSVRGDELLPTRDAGGFVRIQSIKEIVENRTNHSSFSIKNDELYEDHITDYISHPQKENLFKVTLEGGRNITVTKSHSIYFHTPSLGIFKKPVSEAKVGDVVVVSTGKIKPEKMCEEITFEGRKFPITKNFMRFLGYFIAEGSFSFQRDEVPHGITLTFGKSEKEQRLVADAIELLEEIEVGNVKLDEYENKISVRMSSKWFCSFLLSLNFGRLQPERKVPDIVLNVSDSHKKEFLKGLYAGDGNYRNSKYSGNKKGNRNELCLKTSSKNLQRTLAFLLDSLGIQAIYREGINPVRYIEGRKLSPSEYFVVSVSSKEDIEKLLEVVLFLGKTPIYSNSKYSCCKKKRNVVFISKDCIGVKIKKIEEITEIDEKVYDISVGDTHRFESSFRILCSNTGGGDPTMYAKINELILACVGMGLKVGFITNGILLKKNLLDTSLDMLHWVRVSMNCLDYVESVDLPELKGTLGFSYVMNDKTDGDVLRRLDEHVKKFNPKYVRIVPNCQVSDAVQKTNNDVYSAMVEKMGTPYFYQRKEFCKPERCWWGYFKPFLLHNGYVYPCSSVVLNDSSDRSFHTNFRWFDMEYFPEIYLKKMESFSTHMCNKCVFYKQNQMVDCLVNQDGMEDFV